MFNKLQMMIEEQKPNNSTETAILPMQCYAQPFFETASFHIVKPCNMRCKFCYATFEDMHIVNQLSKYDAFKIIDKFEQRNVAHNSQIYKTKPPTKTIKNV